MAGSGKISLFLWTELVSILLIIAALSYAALFLRNTTNVDITPSTVVPGVIFSNTETSFDKDIVPLDVFTGLVESRNLFVPPAPPAPVLPMVAESEEVPQHFKVVGVITGRNPQVIIEDTGLKKTLFIQPGSGEGGVNIDKIEDGFIFLTYENKLYKIPLEK